MRVSAHTEIAAPRQHVWDTIVDPDRHLEIMDGMTRWEVEGAKRQGLGTRFTMRMRVGSVELGGRIEVVEYDPPCDMAWTSVTGVEHRGRWRLRKLDESRTGVQLRVTYHAPGGFMGSVADLVAAPIVRGHLERSLQELKRRVEKRTADAHGQTRGRLRRFPARSAKGHKHPSPGRALRSRS